MRHAMRMLAPILTLALLPTAAVAQSSCSIGVYPNAEGIPGVGNWDNWTLLDYDWDTGIILHELEVYYVVFVEGLVKGAAWNRVIELPDDVEVLATVQHYDPLEQFLEVTENGFRMGIGDCQSGFGGNPVMVLRENFILEKRLWGKAGSPLPTDPPYVVIYMEPNVLEDPQFGVYADCTDAADKHLCSLAGPYRTPVGVEDSESWGALKAIYR